MKSDIPIQPKSKNASMFVFEHSENEKNIESEECFNPVNI